MRETAPSPHPPEAWASARRLLGWATARRNPETSPRDGGDAHAWHDRPASEALESLGVHPGTGLDDDEAERRRSRFGPNAQTEHRDRPAIARFLLQFHAPLVYILLVSTVATLLLGDYVDSSVIFGVVFVNSVIGFVQESRALRAIHSLAHRLAGQATVVRGGDMRRIPASDVVPGDLVVLQSGDKVPADVRLLHVRELRVDESLLTGESIPVAKHAEAVAPGALLAERSSMAYATTLATYGQARGVAVATGDRTEIGRISRLIAGAEELATPLTRKLARFRRRFKRVVTSWR